MAERSKAADLSSVISGCVGSNPTSGKHNIYIFIYYIYINIGDIGVVVSISASQADDPGSNPGCRINFFI